MLNNVAPFQLLSNDVLFLKVVSRLRVLDEGIVCKVFGSGSLEASRN